MVRTKLQYQHLEKIKIKPRICRISKYINRATKERQSIARSRLGDSPFNPNEERWFIPTPLC
jgi:hypothetical protein